MDQESQQLDTGRKPKRRRVQALGQREFVLKRCGGNGPGATSAHIASEFCALAIYDRAGAAVPRAALYFIKVRATLHTCQSCQRMFAMHREVRPSQARFCPNLPIPAQPAQPRPGQPHPAQPCPAQPHSFQLPRPDQTNPTATLCTAGDGWHFGDASEVDAH
jgi:hypothetical protein